MRQLSSGSPGQLIPRCDSDCGDPDRGVPRKGKDMMKVSRKLIVIGAASVLGVAMTVGVASAATGSLTAHEEPDPVLQTRWVW